MYVTNKMNSALYLKKKNIYDEPAPTLHIHFDKL